MLLIHPLSLIFIALYQVKSCLCLSGVNLGISLLPHPHNMMHSQGTRSAVIDTKSLRKHIQNQKSPLQRLHSWIQSSLFTSSQTPVLITSAFRKLQPHSIFSHRHDESAIDLSDLVSSASDAEDYFQHVGIQALINEISSAAQTKQIARVTKGLNALAHIIRICHDKSLADEVAVQLNSLLASICGSAVQKYRWLDKLYFWSKVAGSTCTGPQIAAMRLISSIVQKSDRATKILYSNASLVKHVLAIGEQHAADKNACPNSTSPLSYSEASRVAMWGLGGVPWKPRMPGHRGLRILSFDGGGTRGVLSVALLQELLNKINRPDIPLHHMFDVICGTSTGGIIAVQLGIMLQNITEVDRLYNHYIDAIFGKKSNLKLVASRALYDEQSWERLLENMCGNASLLESNRNGNTPRVFCVSSQCNRNSPQPHIWRNYNLPHGTEFQHPGCSRIATKTAVRATTAAPMYFTPVVYEGEQYMDGALVANNPTAIAIQEARMLHPGVPIELVVSIGTGTHRYQNASSKSMGWDGLVRQLVISSTDTEDIHRMLLDFLPSDRYLRLNPALETRYAIDERSREAMDDLRGAAKQLFIDMERNKFASKKLDAVVARLRGDFR